MPRETFLRIGWSGIIPLAVPEFVWPSQASSLAVVWSAGSPMRFLKLTSEVSQNLVTIIVYPIGFKKPIVSVS
ncbi:hypothetical protein GCM10028819_27050 [Spirosoma humi]